MALPAKLIALLGSGALAASAAAYFVMAPSSGPSAGDASGSAGDAAESSPAAETDEEEDGLQPCIAPDRILYASTSGGPCLPGHKRLRLKDDEEDGTCELCDPFDDEEGREKAYELEARIEALEKTAYFEVVDKDDRVIFRVGPEGARLFDARSNPVADLGGSAAGGWLTLRSGDAEVSFAATGSSGMRIREGGVTRMDVGTVQGGPYALRVSSPTSIIAGIGQSRAGGGAVIVGTPTQAKATLTINDGRGMVSVFNRSAKDGAALTEARIGGGLLDLGLADGNAAVRMGHNGNRYGIVLAGPVLGLPLVPRTGLPGSYFMGCASGERPACVPSVAAGN
jgi:hypothetical protein